MEDTGDRDRPTYRVVDVGLPQGAPSAPEPPRYGGRPSPSRRGATRADLSPETPRSSDPRGLPAPDVGPSRFGAPDQFGGQPADRGEPNFRGGRRADVGGPSFRGGRPGDVGEPSFGGGRRADAGEPRFGATRVDPAEPDFRGPAPDQAQSRFGGRGGEPRFGATRADPLESRLAAPTVDPVQSRVDVGESRFRAPAGDSSEPRFGATRVDLAEPRFGGSAADGGGSRFGGSAADGGGSRFGGAPTDLGGSRFGAGESRLAAPAEPGLAPVRAEPAEPRFGATRIDLAEPAESRLGARRADLAESVGSTALAPRPARDPDEVTDTGARRARSAFRLATEATDASEADDAEDADEDEHQHEPALFLQWVVFVAQTLTGAIAGLGVWLGFYRLWSTWPFYAVPAVGVAAIGMLVLARALRRRHGRDLDLLTAVVTAGVITVLTVLPAAFTLQGLTQ
jgi:hypothetical protein